MDVEPDLVAGVVALEPAGPPFGTAMSKNNRPRVYSQFIEREESIRIYGVADIPLTYDPPTHPHEGFERPARDPLDIESRTRPDRLGSCFLQKDTDPEVIEIEPSGEPVQPCPVRQLIHLKKAPHAIITAHASPHSVYDWATVAFLQQAGVSVDWLRLENFGILGNGHLMFLETNSNKVAGVVEKWIIEHTPAEGSEVKTDPNPNTPRTLNMVSSAMGHTTESECSGASKSSPRPLAEPSSTGIRGNLPSPLGRSSLSRVENHLQAAAPASGPAENSQAPKGHGKRRLGLRSPKHSTASPPLDYEPKRQRMGERAHESTLSSMLPSSEPVYASQLGQRPPMGTFPSPQGRLNATNSPHPASGLNMLRSSHPGGPSELRQQWDMITRDDLEHQRRRLVQHMSPLASNAPSHGLYSHLAVGSQTSGQSPTYPMPHNPRLLIPRSAAYSEAPTGSYSDLPPGRSAGTLEQRAGTLGGVFISAIRRRQRQQPDSSVIDPQLSTPANPHSGPRYNSTPLTPSAQTQANGGHEKEAGYGPMPAVTPPSPSPAPRGA